MSQSPALLSALRELLAANDHFDYTKAFYMAAIDEGMAPDHLAMNAATERKLKAEEAAREAVRLATQA